MELFGILAKSNLCWFTNIDYFFVFMLCLLEVERTVEGYFPCAVRMAVRMFSIGVSGLIVHSAPMISRPL